MYVMNSNEIKELRRLLGITSDELADRLGVTGNTVRRWECNVRDAKGSAAKIMRSWLADAREEARKQPA